MARVLVLDDDPAFLMKIQEKLPEDTECLATMNAGKAVDLLRGRTFDSILVRRRNRRFLAELWASPSLSADAVRALKKKVIVLKRWGWGRCRQILLL